MAIKSKDEMMRLVTDNWYGTYKDLDRSFFDFDVEMPIKDILNTYAALQKKLNGDFVFIGKEWPVNGVYKGNCREFLVWLNDHTDCKRYSMDNSGFLCGPYDFIP